MSDVGLAAIAEWTDEFSWRLAVTLLHFIWQGIVVGLLVLLGSRLLRRRSASARYALFTAALLQLPVCVVLTFASVDVPGDRARAVSGLSGDVQRSIATDSADELLKSAQRFPPSAQKDTSGSGVIRPPQIAVRNSDVNGDSTSSVTQMAPTETVLPGRPLTARVAPAVILFYLAGVMVFLLRVFLGVWGSRRLCSGSIVVDDHRLQELVLIQARKLGLRVVPVMRFCERVSVPVVVGVLRPVILIPISVAAGLSPTQMSAILLHELAHIRRFDPWVNLLQRVIESLLFFHPVVWFISRRMSVERETCCDDLVVSTGYEPLYYAGAILRTAELSADVSRLNAHALALSGDGSSQLSVRIRRLLLMDGESGFRLTPSGAMLIAVITLMIPGLSAVVHGLATDARDLPRLPNNASATTSASANAVAANPKPVAREQTEPVPESGLSTSPLRQSVSDTMVPVWVLENVGNDPFVLPDGQRFLTGTMIRDVATGQIVGRLNIGQHSPRVMSISANGRYLLTGHSEPMTTDSFRIPPIELQVWDLVTVRKVGRAISVPWRLPIRANNVVVSSDGNHIAAACHDSLASSLGPNGVLYDPETDQVEPIRNQGGLLIWNVATAEQVTYAYHGRCDHVSAIAMASDNEWIVIAEHDKLTFWEWKKNKPMKAWATNHRVESLAFSPGGRYLAWGPRSPKADVFVHDLPDWKNSRAFSITKPQALLVNRNALIFTRDGRRLIAGNAVSADELTTHHRVAIWDVDSGNLLQEISVPHHQVWSLDATPDGSQIVARLVDGDQSLVAMWPIRTGGGSKSTDAEGNESDNPAVKPPFDRAATLQTFAAQLRDAAPADWIVQQKDRAFRLLGPEVDGGSDRARLLVWMGDVSIESSKLRHKDGDELEFGHLDNTQLGRVFVARNEAARKLWPAAYMAIRQIQPVEHIAFADLDDLRNIQWFDAAYVRDVSISRDGKLQRLLAREFTTETGMSSDTRFLVIGRLPDPQTARSAQEKEHARQFLANVEVLRTTANRLGVRIISVDEFAAYTRNRLSSGRGFPTRWVNDPEMIQPPDSLLDGEGLETIPIQLDGAKGGAEPM